MVQSRHYGEGSPSDTRRAAEAIAEVMRRVADADADADTYAWVNYYGGEEFPWVVRVRVDERTRVIMTADREDAIAAARAFIFERAGCISWLAAEHMARAH